MRRMVRKLIRNFGFERRIAPSFVNIMTANNCDIVIDVGANDGDYGREIRDAGYRRRIHSFEPNPTAFTRLTREIRNDPLWTAVPFGVGDKAEMMTLNISSSDVFSSFKELNSFGNSSKRAKVIDSVPAEVIRLDEYFYENPDLIQRPYLKIDTQGFEREVLSGLGEFMNRMVAIQVETTLVDTYQDECDWVETIVFMRDMGFEVATMICNSSLQDKSRAREFDIVFVSNGV